VELPPLTIEVLSVPACPHRDAVLRTLDRELDDRSIDAAITVREVHSVDEARALRFLGSPTVRINGRDIEPAAAARSDYGLGCRIYRDAEGVSGVPSAESVAAALSATEQLDR
jgi:glutaredoxin